MKRARSRLETAFLWAWALLFAVGVLAGGAEFGIETFEISLHRQIERALLFLIAVGFYGSVFGLPFWAAAIGSGFFEKSQVRWGKSPGCAGCWLQLVIPASLIALACVWADDVFPPLFITASIWTWRVVTILCFLPWIFSILAETWLSSKKRVQQLKNWFQIRKSKFP